MSIDVGGEGRTEILSTCDYSKLDLNFTWIDTDDRCAEMVSILEKESEIAVDVEGSSLYHYRDRISLIQIASRRQKFVIDPFGINSWNNLTRLLASPEIKKVFHGCEHDVRSFDRDYQIQIGNIYDTKVAAELSGMTTLSLAGLIEYFFGVKISKKYQTYNWSLRPVIPQALAYAVCDTHFLLEIKDRLNLTLAQYGRDRWAEEEFQHLQTQRWKPSRNQELGFRAFPGIQRMTDASVLLLQALWEWRERTAESRDVPPFRIISNEDLIQIATQLPSSRLQLDEVISRNRNAASFSNEIWNVISSKKNSSKLPHHRSYESKRFNSQQQAQLKVLKDLRGKIADELGLNAPLIASRDALEQLVALDVSVTHESIPLIRERTGMRRWQIELLVEGLEKRQP